MEHMLEVMRPFWFLYLFIVIYYNIRFFLIDPKWYRDLFIRDDTISMFILQWVFELVGLFSLIMITWNP